MAENFKVNFLKGTFCCDKLVTEFIFNLLVAITFVHLDQSRRNYECGNVNMCCKHVEMNNSLTLKIAVMDIHSAGKDVNFV
jgi:hypothetical protein